MCLEDDAHSIKKDLTGTCNTVSNFVTFQRSWEYCIWKAGSSKNTVSVSCSELRKLTKHFHPVVTDIPVLWVVLQRGWRLVRKSPPPKKKTTTQQNSSTPRVLKLQCANFAKRVLNWPLLRYVSYIACAVALGVDPCRENRLCLRPGCMLLICLISESMLDCQSFAMCIWIQKLMKLTMHYTKLFLLLVSVTWNDKHIAWINLSTRPSLVQSLQTGPHK